MIRPPRSSPLSPPTPLSRPPAAAAAPAKAPANEVKAGKDLIFKVGGGEVQLYGHADVSLDDQVNGMDGYLNGGLPVTGQDRKSTRLNSSHLVISYAVFCLKK